MRVGLVNPLIQPSLWEDDLIARWPPLGLAYIAAYLEGAGHTVQIVERRRLIGERTRDPAAMEALDRDTLSWLEDFQPDLVGLTATTPLVSDAFRVARSIRSRSREVPIVMGGSHATVEPKLTLTQCPELSAVVRGEGEEPLLEMADGRPWREIESLTYWEAGELRSTPARRAIDDLDKIPFPARHLLDREFYFQPNSTLIRGFYLSGTPVFTARGCPYGCAFCASDALGRSNQGKRVRLHSAERVLQEIVHLVEEYGIEGLLFAEDLFSVKRDRALEIVRGLREKGLHKKLTWAANLRVDSVDEELLAEMKEAGCSRVIFGIESGSPATLANMRKRSTVERNARAIALSKGVGITCEANVIIGLPGEREEDFRETVSFLKRTRPDRINKGKLYPIPGTHFYRALLEQGRIRKPENWDELWDSYVQGDFTFAEMDPRRFSELRAAMEREVVLPANYLFAFRTNLRRNLPLALRQLALMVAHRLILYLPLSVQRVARRVAGALRFKSRYVFE